MTSTITTITPRVVQQQQVPKIIAAGGAINIMQFNFISIITVMLILILSPSSSITYVTASSSSSSSSKTATTATDVESIKSYTFAIIPKSKRNPFFDDVIKGCESRSKELLQQQQQQQQQNVTCLFVGPTTQNAIEQASIIDDLIMNSDNGNNKIDGIAVSVIDSDAIKDVLLKAKSSGIQVITFDSDIEIDDVDVDIDVDIDIDIDDSTSTTSSSSSQLMKQEYRSTYVGTDNIAFGEQIGKTLIELQPNGGKYGVITNSDPNLLLREQGFRNILILNNTNTTTNNSNWIEVNQSPMDIEDNKFLALGQMHVLVAENTDLVAIVSLLGAPMFDTPPNDRGWEDFAIVHTGNDKDLILVCADSLPIQVEYLHKGYAHGLIGQIPFDMGIKSFDTLLELVTIDENENENEQQATIVPEIIHTDLVEFVLLSSSLGEDILPSIEDGSNNNNNNNTMDDDDDDDDNEEEDENTSSSSSSSYVFAIVSKSISIPFFDDVKAGCEARAETITRTTSTSDSNSINVECMYTGPIEQDDPLAQATIIEDLIKNDDVDGIAFSVIDINIAYNLTVMAREANIPIITFDSDAPLSKRSVYVGTDNIQLGNELGNTLLLVVEEEGNEQQQTEEYNYYGAVSNLDPNLQLRTKGLNDVLLSTSTSASNVLWKQVDNSPTNFGGNTTLALEQMNDLITTTPTIDAIFSTAGRPMRDVEEWKDFVSNNINTNDNDNSNNIKLIVADTHPDQVKLLQQKYVNGLVGQTPFLMGSTSIDVLLKLAKAKATTIDNTGNDDNTDIIGIEEYMYTNLVRARLIESKNQKDNIDDGDGDGNDDLISNNDSSNASSSSSSSWLFPSIITTTTTLAVSIFVFSSL